MKKAMSVNDVSAKPKAKPSVHNGFGSIERKEEEIRSDDPRYFS